MSMLTKTQPSFGHRPVASLTNEEILRYSRHLITARELKQRLNRRDELFILDVREPHEYQICNLKGHLIPLGELPRRMHELHSSHEIVALCRSGRRSAQAVEFPWKAGFRKVLNLRGGMLSWPTEVDPTLPRY
jgi:rhodanese-related sulfurtransferase